jgi:hypothetical protein
MPSIPSRRQVFADLMQRYGQEVAEAFFEAIDDLRSAVELQRVIAAIQKHDLEGALDALRLDPAAYNDMLDKIAEAHKAGGKAAVDTFPSRDADGAVMIVRFDGRNLAAEAWLRMHSSDLVTRITEDQKTAVRASLSDSMRRGVNPRTAALDVVGRINRTTGKREGGILGLTSVQEGYVAAARAELTSADQKDLKNYLARSRRDKRFDRTVEKAIREETAIPAATATRAAIAYERRLLQLRGETIGRVEAMTALQKGKRQAYEQAIAAGKIRPENVRKTWRSAGDLRVRHTHDVLNGQVVGFNDAFVSPSGARMLYPMDGSLGAGPGEIISCRCDCDYRIDFLANLR